MEGSKIEFKDLIEEKNNCYYKLVSSNISNPISNFIIEPIERIEGDNINQLKVILKNNSSKKITRVLNYNDLNSVSKLRNAIDSLDFSFLGSDKDLQIIKMILASKKVPIRKGVSYTGIHKIGADWIFVNPEIAIDKNEKIINDVVLLNGYDQLKSSICNINRITKDELTLISRSLFRFNDIKKTSIILGFISSVFLKEKLWINKIPLNHLIIAGEAGSGKSQTCRHVIMKFFSLDNAYSASNITEFTAMKIASSSNTLPFIIEEYKPNRIGSSKVASISNILRNSYDRHKAARGKSDQSITYYNLQAPIIIIGEMSISETAIKERSLEVLFSKADLNEDNKYHFNVLKENSLLLQKLGKSLLMQALTVDVKELDEVWKYYFNNKVDSDIVNERIRCSIANCMTGLHMIKRLFETLDLVIDDCIKFNFDLLIDSVNKATIEYLLENNKSSKSIIDTTLEIFNKMALNNKLTYNRDFKLINKGKELALNITKFYDIFTKYVKEHNIDQEILNQNDFTKQLGKTTYFNSYKPVRLEGKATKCYVLDINLLKQNNINVEALLNENVY